MRLCKTASMTRALCSGGACGDAVGENGNAGSDGGHADFSYLTLMTRLLSGLCLVLFSSLGYQVIAFFFICHLIKRKQVFS